MGNITVKMKTGAVSIAAALLFASTPGSASGPGDPNGYFICHRDAVVLCQDGSIDRERYDSYDACVAGETADCMAIGSPSATAAIGTTTDVWDRKATRPIPA